LGIAAARLSKFVALANRCAHVGLPGREIFFGVLETKALAGFQVACFAWVIGYNRGLFSSNERIPMVVIRLARSGAKKRPFYNLVVTDSRNRRDGRFVERIGFYNPVAAESEEGLRVAMDRLTYWQQNGAQLSPTATRLVKQYAAKQAA
jgi:small subunit ribosomal protein S16